MTTLFVGCSFLQSLSAHYPNCEKYHIFSSPGSGNQAIAARTVYQLGKHKYSDAVILWSGVNRLDVPVPTTIHNAWAPDGWVATCEIGDSTWYHSGGPNCSGQTNPTPKLIQKWFRQQYVGSGLNSLYLAEQTLLAIVTTQAVLQQHDVPYKMAWIYNTDHGNVGSQHEPSHGKLVKDTPYFNLVDWSRFAAKISPYEWAQQKNMFDKDQYHPSLAAMIDWLREELAYDFVPHNSV